MSRGPIGRRLGDRARFAPRRLQDVSRRPEVHVLRATSSSSASVLDDGGALNEYALCDD